MIKIASAHLKRKTTVRFEHKEDFNSAEEAREICLILFTLVPGGVFDEVARFIEYYLEKGESMQDLHDLLPSDVAEMYFEKRIQKLSKEEES